MAEVTINTKFGETIIRAKNARIDDWRGWTTEIENKHSGKFYESSYDSLTNANEDVRWLANNPEYVENAIAFVREEKIQGRWQ